VRELAGFIEVRRNGRNLVLREITSRVTYQFVFFGDIEVGAKHVY
jgi:hypothetical protein